MGVTVKGSFIVMGDNLNDRATKVVINNSEDKDRPFPVSDMFNGEKHGIADRKQFWLLLVACMARGRNFNCIPEYIEWAFKTFKVPFDKKECLDSTQEKLKAKNYASVHNQQTMLEFISCTTVQPQKKANDLRVAQNLFVALKQIPLGEK